MKRSEALTGCEAFHPTEFGSLVVPNRFSSLPVGRAVGHAILMANPQEGSSWAYFGEYDDLLWLSLAQHLRGRGFRVHFAEDVSIKEFLVSKKPSAFIINVLARTSSSALSEVELVRSVSTEIPIYAVGKGSIEFSLLCDSRGLDVEASTEDSIASSLGFDGQLVDRGSSDASWWRTVTPRRPRGPKAPVGVIDVEATRGCSHACSFCSVRATGGPETWTPRPPRSIALEIRKLIDETGCLYFQFIDDNFLGSPQASVDWAFALCDDLPPNISFSIYARLDETLLSCLPILADAGLVQVHGGIESASPRMLALYNKGIALNVMSNCVDALRDMGVELVPSFIIFDPRSLPEDVLATLDWIEKRDMSLWFTPSELIPYRNTEVTFLGDGALWGSDVLAGSGRVRINRRPFESRAVGWANTLAHRYDRTEGSLLSYPLDELMAMRMRRDADLRCTPPENSPALVELRDYRLRQMDLVNRILTGGGSLD